MNFWKGLLIGGAAVAGLFGIAVLTTPKRESAIGKLGEDKIDDSNSFDYYSYVDEFNESQAKKKITTSIRKITKDAFGRELYSCAYIGATSDALERFKRHNRERRSKGEKEFSKLFILTTLIPKIKAGKPDWRSAKAKTEELEEHYIERMKDELILLENISDESTGLLDGAEKYCIYIAVCDANQA